MHTMTLVTEHEGTQEWLCPICGRRLLVEFNPEWRRVVVEAGDEMISHTGATGFAISLEVEQ